MSRPNLTETNVLRFTTKVDTTPGPDACWPWKAYRDRHGYGKINIRGDVHYASRIAFLLANDDWPAAVCHRCDNPPCCNPAHLFGGTQVDNYRDMERKGRSGAGKACRAKTHCPQGHEYTPENVYLKTRPDGGMKRNCAVCAREYSRNYYHSTKGKIA